MTALKRRISQSNQTEYNKTNKNHTENSQSVFQSRDTFFRSRGAPSGGRKDSPYSLEEILENCELDTFPQEERKILYDALERLFYSERLKIGNAVLPREKVRSRMYEITAETLRTAIFKLHQNSRPISNMTAYVMSTIFNCITEEYTLLHIDPYLNALRQPVRRE